MKIRKHENIYIEKIVVALMLMLMFFTAAICFFYRGQGEPEMREIYHGRHHYRLKEDCAAPFGCPYRDMPGQQAKVSFHYPDRRGMFQDDLKYVLKEAYPNRDLYQKEKEKLLSDCEFVHHGPPAYDKMILSSHSMKNDVFCIFNDSEYAIVYGYFSAGVRPNMDLYEKLKKF